MKVAICNVQEFNPEIGGIERISISLANILMQLGIKVIFIACRKSPYGGNYILPAKQYFLPQDLDYSEDNIDTFCNIINSENVNIILNQNSHSKLYNKTCFEVKVRTKVKLISVFHFAPDMRIKANRNIVDFKYLSLRRNFINGLRTICTYFPFRYITLYAHRKMYRILYDNSDRVILLSDGFIPLYEKLAGIKENSKLAAINNMLSFPVETFEYTKKKQILYCSRLEFTQKRPDRMLSIWHKIQHKIPDWNLVVVGDGPERVQLENMSTKMNLQHISFEGFQNPIEYFKESSIFCMTSNHEGWGLVLTEAMQYGCVPIAFNSYESVLDIIDSGENGFLISPFDLDEYADKIIYLSQNKLETFSEKAFKSVQRFDVNQIGKKWQTLLNMVFHENK